MGRDAYIVNGPNGRGQAARNAQVSHPINPSPRRNRTKQKLQVKAAGPSSSWIQNALDAPQDFVTLDGAGGDDGS